MTFLSLVLKDTMAMGFYIGCFSSLLKTTMHLFHCMYMQSISGHYSSFIITFSVSSLDEYSVFISVGVLYSQLDRRLRHH